MTSPTLRKISSTEFILDPQGDMRVPGIFFASRALLQDMDEKVFEQTANVASLPGIVHGSLAMPDAHSGYGFPIGGVGAFDPDRSGIISAGGVGFDIACGVRTLHTGLHADDIMAKHKEAADILYKMIPAGLGVRGSIKVKKREMDAMLHGGARWAVSCGYGLSQDLERIEENGCMQHALPDKVSDHAKQRQEQEMGTLGSGNHYLEVQEITRIFDPAAADGFGIKQGDVMVSIHCGSRGLGHQIGKDYLQLMAKAAAKHKIHLPDRELACAPIRSKLGKDYLGAMRAGINCALANRQILTHLTRLAFERLWPRADLRLLYDVAHNTCKEETHNVDGQARRLFVHRKGATRSLGPNHPDLPASLRSVGQPVLIGGSMGTGSYILAGTTQSEEKSFSSANHGAGRTMSRSQAKKRFRGREVVDSLEEYGVQVRAQNYRSIAEEAPGAYKDVDEVVRVVEDAGLAKVVAHLRPLISIKG